MRVKVEYKNSNMEQVFSNEVEFKDFCNIMNKKILSILFKIDDYSANKIDYKELRKYILNIAGNIERLPDNIKG